MTMPTTLHETTGPTCRTPLRNQISVLDPATAQTWVEEARAEVHALTRALEPDVGWLRADALRDAVTAPGGGGGASGAECDGDGADERLAARHDPHPR